LSLSKASLIKYVQVLKALNEFFSGPLASGCLNGFYWVTEVFSMYLFFVFICLGSLCVFDAPGVVSRTVYS
jgi:hypothetical protein